jgi:multicomponent Na+:H+ antiporter subunit D
MTNHLPILSVIVLFLGAFLVAIFGGKNSSIRKGIVTVATSLSFIFVVMLIKPIMIDGNVIAYWMGNWAPVDNWAIGIGFEVDQLSLFFAIIVVLTVLLSAIFSFKYMSKDNSLDKYYVLFLMLSGAVLGLVFTGDLFNMFVMIEILTFSAVALTAFRNYFEGALEAAFKYIVVGGLGSSMILLGTVILYSQVHTLNLAQMAALLHDNYTAATLFAFALLFAGFGVKSLLYHSTLQHQMHIWLHHHLYQWFSQEW